MIKCECPCKDCTRRKLGCHENCVKYKIYRELYYRDKRKKEIYFAMHSNMSEMISKRVILKTKYQLMKRKAGN